MTLCDKYTQDVSAAEAVLNPVTPEEKKYLKLLDDINAAKDVSTVNSLVTTYKKTFPKGTPIYKEPEVNKAADKKIQSLLKIDLDKIDSSVTTSTDEKAVDIFKKGYTVKFTKSNYTDLYKAITAVEGQFSFIKDTAAYEDLNQAIQNKKKAIMNSELERLQAVMAKIQPALETAVRNCQSKIGFNPFPENMTLDALQGILEGILTRIKTIPTLSAAHKADEVSKAIKAMQTIYDNYVSNYAGTYTPARQK